MVSEDSICHLTDRQPVHVLNQWTYHARLYRAARYATEHDDTELVQLVRNHMIGVRFNPKDISERFEKDTTRPEYKEIAQYIGAITF